MKGECLSAVINAANLAVERMDGRTIGVQSAKGKFIGFFLFESKECGLFKEFKKTPECNCRVASKNSCIRDYALGEIPLDILKMHQIALDIPLKKVHQQLLLTTN